jgi:hypothetical protein
MFRESTDNKHAKKAACPPNLQAPNEAGHMAGGSAAATWDVASRRVFWITRAGAILTGDLPIPPWYFKCWI